MKTKLAILILFVATLALPSQGQKRRVDFVNTFLGTAPLTDPADIGFNPPWRVWAGLVFPWCS
jgi:hypothetical protein